MKAKYELIAFLKKNGQAFFNTGNSYIQTMIGWVREDRPDLHVTQYNLNAKNKEEIFAENIKVCPKNLCLFVLLSHSN